MLADGLSRDQIARERGVASATIQSQLKSIFAKTGVSREAALAVKLRKLLER
jgi:DNA-binding CsgD family transcriptional regulator